MREPPRRLDSRAVVQERVPVKASVACRGQSGSGFAYSDKASCARDGDHLPWLRLLARLLFRRFKSSRLSTATGVRSVLGKPKLFSERRRFQQVSSTIQKLFSGPAPSHLLYINRTYRIQSPAGGPLLRDSWFAQPRAGPGSEAPVWKLENVRYDTTN